MDPQKRFIQVELNFLLHILSFLLPIRPLLYFSSSSSSAGGDSVLPALVEAAGGGGEEIGQRSSGTGSGNKILLN